MALTTATTLSPFLSFNSSALRRVMALSIRFSPTRTTTWAMTVPNWTSSMVPRSLFLAEIVMF